MMRLTNAPFWLAAAISAAGCGANPAYDYPASARAQFEQTCPAGDPVCECTWERVTQSTPYAEYEAALERYRVEGLMDPRITRARAYCLNRYGERS